MQGDENCFAVLSELCRDPDPKIRVMAIQGLRQMKDIHRSAAILERMETEDTDLGVQSDAGDAMASLRRRYNWDKRIGP
jgi:HEAT repeat protein